MSVRILYSKLSDILTEANHLRSINTVLDWDQQVMMPNKSAEARGKQMATLAGILHEKNTNPEIGRLLSELEDPKNEKDIKSSLNVWELANIRDARRNFNKATKITKELAQKEALLSSKGYNTWVEAKKDNDFNKFAPIIKEWIIIKQEIAKCIDSEKNSYDVLLDDYERGLTSSRLEEIFKNVKSVLVPLIEDIKQKSIPDTSFLQPPFPVSKQIEFNQGIAKTLGFDTESGRLDVSAHPMTIDIHPTDVRMTTRYKEEDLFEGITGTVHETGHALYEQGRNKEYACLPVSSALSMGIHESQSLTWERMVGLSEEFWEYYTPILTSIFTTIPKETTHIQMWKAINKVQPGLIRVESDEVTYPMHIILRYEIEKGLMDGSIQVEDLPRLWNEKMEKYLGVKVPNDASGVLQDVHWSLGLIGYFPTYLLGAIYATQFFKKAEKDIPQLYKEFKVGNFSSLRNWLLENIHQKGSLIPSGDLLCKEVTGEILNPDLFTSYLKDKYTKVYQ